MKKTLIQALLGAAQVATTPAPAQTVKYHLRTLIAWVITGVLGLIALGFLAAYGYTILRQELADPNLANLIFALIFMGLTGGAIVWGNYLQNQKPKTPLRQLQEEVKDFPTLTDIRQAFERGWTQGRPSDS